MKPLTLFFLSLLTGVLWGCQNQPAARQDDSKDFLPTTLVHNPQSASGTDSGIISKLPVLVFPDTLYNFGRVQAGERVEHAFRFRNAGGGPLILSGAEGSCGCTVADYPREPMAPGSSGMIKVVFNSAGKQGHVEKAVTVTSNSASGNRRLYIQAEVLPGTE